MGSEACVFCRIVQEGSDAGTGGGVPSHIVHQDRDTLSLLDHRPLFPGHCLVIPRSHVETLDDLPDDLLAPVFASVRLLARAVVAATKSEGCFVGINNRVSQSVPHLHVHVVPRRKGDGLRGFFWPRVKYGEGEMEETGKKIRSALGRGRREGET